MEDIKRGFAPCCFPDSRVLILGSFPSVISRKVDFYYGNPHNRFWKILSEFFNQPLPDSTESKKEFLKNHKVALWDVVQECEIKGSSDSAIKNYKIAAVDSLIVQNRIKSVILNGSKAAEIYFKNFKELNVKVIKLPSTSPANTRLNVKDWYDGLSSAFSGT